MLRTEDSHDKKNKHQNNYIKHPRSFMYNTFVSKSRIKFITRTCLSFLFIQFSFSLTILVYGCCDETNRERERERETDDEYTEEIGWYTQCTVHIRTRVLYRGARVFSQRKIRQRSKENWRKIVFCIHKHVLLTDTQSSL